MLWVSEFTLIFLCFWDSEWYKTLADVSFGICWGYVVLIVLAVGISASYVNRALRKLGVVQDLNLIGRAFYRIRLSWVLTLLVGTPALVILPLLAFEVMPFYQYMYILFSMVLGNASLATGLILLEFRGQPGKGDVAAKTAVERSLIDSSATDGSTVMISATANVPGANPQSKSIPWREPCIDQDF